MQPTTSDPQNDLEPPVYLVISPRKIHGMTTPLHLQRLVSGTPFRTVLASPLSSPSFCSRRKSTLTCALFHHHHHHHYRSPRFCFFTTATTSSNTTVDLRSDTVTQPTRPMLEAALTAPLGDDVMGEDPTVQRLERYMADLFGKEQGLFVPTGTMSNLCALLAHCDKRASEIIIGAKSHICLWEGGGASNLGGIHTLQLPEDGNGQLDPDAIRNAVRPYDDDHWPETQLLCLETTHNMCGGVALPQKYLDAIGHLVHHDLLEEDRSVQLHVDGARIMNAVVALDTPAHVLCRNVDSVSICLSKGLGAPLGSVLVGSTEIIRLAKRARKRCGGGMRQVGVVAAMGLYAIQRNVERLADDHRRAQKLGMALHEAGFFLPRNGQIDTNIVYFGLPDDCRVTRDEFASRLETGFGVKLTGGYSEGGRLFRAVTHLQIDDAGIDRAIEAILSTATTTTAGRR